MKRIAPLALRAVALALTFVAPAMLTGCAMPQRLSPSASQIVAQRVYVVTGASSGFGRGIAEQLGRHRASVVLAARRADALEEVATAVRANGGTALVVPTDVSDAAAMERLSAATLTRFGRIDVWINNAGIGAIGRFEEIPVADQARIVDVNLKGVIYGSHLAIRQFKRQGHGILINLGSVESRVPLAYHATYAATKHAILGLDQALAQELRLAGAKRIKVVTIMPWAADTNYWQHSGNYSGRTPRMILMDDAQKVANAIVWASVHPRKKFAVGPKAKLATFGHRLAPGLTEHIAAHVAHKVQMQDPPPAADTSGAIFEPLPGTTSVSGENRTRIKGEKERARGGDPSRPPD